MKKLLLFFATMLFLAFGLYAVDVQIGEGSATSYDLPINSCYGYSYSQQIYLESELNDNGGGPGPITKIRFYLNTSANPITAWDNWTVYLGSTTKDVFLSTSDWVPVSELTEVFSGTIPNPVAGTWLELTLPTPFNYTGGNLVVAVDENSSGYACSASWGVFDCGDNRGMIYYDDDTNPNPANPPQANKGPIATISRIQFDMAAYVPTTPPNCAVLLGPNDNSTVLLDQVLIWKSGGGAPTSYDVYFGDSNPPPYIQNQIETNYMPSTIAGKTYYWKIVPRNAVGAADGCDIWSFLTPTATQLFESFEATTFPPLGWTNPGNFSRNTGITYHGVASAYKYSTPNESLLTTPMLTITSTSKLEFYARTNAANTFQRIQVKYSTDRLTWEDIGDPVQLGANSPFEYFSVDISSLAGAKSDYYLAFAVYHVGTAGAVFIDKVFGPEVTPVLPGEVTLTVPADGAINVEARAEFSWTPDVTGGIPMGYKVYIDTSNPPAFEWANVTASPFKAEPPLNYSTTYYWRIGAYNAAGETLSSIRSFTTMDDPTITLFQWIEDFGNLASDPFPPLNWKKHSGKLADPTVLYPHPSGTWLQGKWLNNASFENNAAKVRVFSSYINAWLITPPIAIPQDDFELVFDLALMKTNSNNPPQQTGTDDFFAVLVGDGLSWTPANIVRKWDNQGSEYVYNEIPNEGTIIHIPLGEAGTKYLAFYAESTVINADNEIMIDNVKVRQISTCPDPTNLAVSEITSASVILSWTSGGEEELWNVKYGLNGFNPETEGTLVEGVTNPFALTGLSHSTFYDAYVQADCGSNEVSPWSTKVSFRTDCGTHDLPFAEDFNTLSNGDIPYCWTKTHSNWGAVSSTKAGGVANEMRFHYGPSATSVFRLITPPLNGASVSDYLLTFKHYISYYTTPTLFKVQGSTDGENWIDLWSLASPTGNVGPETITIPLTTISGEVFYIAWTFEGNSNNINGWYIDDVTIDLPQECSAPTMLAITNITNSTAKLGWTANSNENKWNIKYGDPGFDPETEGMLIEGVTDNPFIITGLNENSQYDVYVRADCGDGLLSEWSSKVTFQTLCDIYDLPYIQNFDDVTAPAIPMCMTVTDDNGDEKKWVTSTTNPRSSPNCMYMTYNSSISMDDWFFTPGFNLTGGKAYQVDFYYRSSGPNYPEKLKVKWGVEPNAAGMTGGVIWQNDNVINSVYEKATAIFTPNEDGVYYVGWHGYSDPDKFYLCVDDISIYEAPECPPPAMLTATDITTNSALLGWTPGGDENLWNIEYGPAGFELGQGNLITDIADNPYLLSGLTQATAYDFYVQADCGGGELSPWFGPASFITECETMELPYFEDFTGVAVDAIPVCWTRTHNNWGVQSSSIAGGTSPEIRLYWSPSFTDLSMLQSPVFNTVGKTELLLEFKHYLSHWATPYTLGIKTSSDGITWNTVWEVSPSANIAAETKEVIINNSDVGSPTFKFAFFFDGNTYNLNNWNIDDVKLFAPEYGTLSGYVTEATRGVIEGAHVFSGSYEAFTDATGYYEIADMLVDVYDVTCEADGYVSVTEVGVEISANQVTELDFQLGIPSIFVDPESISANTEPGGLATETLTISNPEGTAPLTWSARVKILSDRQSSLPILTQQQLKVIGADEVNPNPSGVKPDCTDEMFDLLASFPVNDVGGTYSIVCDGDFLYTGRWNANGYDKYSLEGEFIEHFEIPGAGKTRDLTFDGQYFYGSPNSATIYQMDFENKTLVSTITATGNIIRAISYDSDNDAFWVTSSNFNGPFKLISRTGETLQTLATTVTGISGIAYDNVSEDGPFLWAYTPASAGQHKLVKVDLTTGAALLTFDLLPYGIFGAGTVSGGLEITDAVVEGKWTFIGCSQNDILFVVELTDSTPPWVTIAPKQGVVDPGSSDQIDVSFNATNLEEGIYFAYINITHNGQEVDNGVITVPVELSVGALAPPQPATLVSPANNATFVPLQPEFTWIANSSAFNRLIITTGAPPFTTTVYTSPWFIGDSFDLASTGLTLEKKKNYNWQVNTKNSAGSVNSPIWKFQTLGAGIFKGLITDAYSGLPLEGVEVTTDPGNYVVFTDNTGNYTIEDVLEGDYTLTANKDGYNTATANGSITHNAITYVNFELNMFLEPPFGLHAEIENIFDVHLTWVEPGTGFEPTWLYYTTIIDNSIGTNSAAEFDVAMRFTPDMLTGFAGGSVTKVKFAPHEPLSVCSYTIKIWQGENPPNLIYSQAVPEIVIDEWNEVILNTPVPFDNTMELWIGYGVNTTTGWPAGCDAGPMVDGFGNMMYFGGQWQTLYQLAPTLTYNWSIQALVEAAKGPITLAPVFEAPVTSNFGGALTLSPNGLSEPVISVPTATRSPRAFLGYNVYRDNTLLALVTDNEYYDLDLAAGTYSYKVTAAYDQGESEPAGPVSVSILAPPTLLIAEQQGPEVFLQWQSNFVGKGVLADGSNKAKAFLDSYTGNTLTEDMQLRLFGGSYQSNQVHSGIRCELECPAGAINESELCSEDLNGGCNAVPEVFEPIAIGDVICGTAWAVEGTRDTDWYELIVTEPKTVTWTVTAEFPVYAFIIDGNNGCDGLEIISVGQADPCDTAVAAAVVTPGIYWLWVANQEFEDYPCGESDNYVAELTAEDIFLPYFKLYRNDVVIGEIYDLYHFDDAIAPGNDYCYSVSEVVSDEGIETAKSNELCVNIPVYGSLAVTPGSLDETHSHPSQVTTKTLTVSNTGAGPIEFDVAVDILGKGNRASGLCIDNLYSTGCFAFDDGLVSWQLANVYQDIPCVDAGDWYHDYTNIVHELEPGETYQVTVETTYSSTYLAIWIDFNDDLLLTPDELLANFYCATGGFHTLDITIPADAPIGNHVLRFRTNWNNVATNPCATYSYGNAADFMANLSSWIGIEPSAGILNVGESMDLVVTFTSANIDYGVHNADILFASNNPFAAQPEVTVPAQLTLLDLRGTFYGQVLDELGNPLEGVTITADEYRALSTITDEQGEYVLKVYPDEYTLTASKVGYISETSMPLTISTGDFILQDFELGYIEPVMISAEADFFGIEVEWEGNPIIDMNGRFADISLSNMAEKSNTSIQDETLLHGPTSVVPKAIAGRAVGDDCNDPIIVGELPYTDVNTTCGRGNTYSETCLGSYDGGEDIVYQLTLTEAKVVTFNLTTTTTWTGMLITQECPIGENCVDYVTGSSGNKTLTVTLTPGTYFIMMDTWPSPACINEFTLEITAEDPCSVECPAGAIPESELCGEDLNGGCNATPVAFESIAIGDVICGTAWADDESRDTDWYELIITEPQILTWTVTAEFPVYAFIIDGNNGCDGLEIISIGQADPCEPAVATATVLPGTYWLWVGSQTYEGNPCGAFNNYVAELTAEEIFITYYNLYRDDEMINTLYGNYYYDEDVEQGETYCYSVEQVLFPDFVSGMSNILCAEVPIQPIISVNPEALIEFLEVGETAEQILSVLNSSAGDLNFTASIIFGKNAVKVSGADITYPQSLGTQEAADVATEVGSNNIGGYSVPIAGTKDLLFNNGPFETGQCATTLAPESAIGQPANTYGFNMNKGIGYSVAEDFTVPAGMMWGIESFEFFGYQTGSSTTSTFTGVFVRIWDGNPMEEGSSVIWGDNATNLMTLTEFTGIYRVSATCETTRPIMRIVAGTPGLELEEGTYWVEFSTTGSLASGPWVILVSLPGSTPVGNALHYTDSWSQLESPTGSGNYVGLPFLVNGTSGIPWLTIDTELGSVSGIGQFDINVTFNATDLEEGVYYASILINSNDPVTPQLNVPVTLFVGEVPSQDILMPLGWSGWSAYINTNGASFENVVTPVVNDMIITQHFTEVFWPQYGINTMGNFTNDHGYISKMSASATLSIEGMMAVPTVALNAGWNLFPILVDCNLDAAEVFGGITGFIIGYEVAGNGIYYPAGSIATLTTLVPGKAYWVKVSGAATYTFPECVKGAKASYIAPLRHTNTTPWNEPTYTGSSHIVVFNADASVSFAKGDMIGAFTNDGACAGLTLCDGKAVSLALFADDITTSVKDGFVQGESLTFKLHRQSNDTEYILVVSYSSQAPNYNGLFEANGLSVINNVTMYATGIGSQDLTSLTVYPNPSQGLFNVSVDNHSQDVNWVVTDAKGRYVMEGRLADSHQIDLRTQPKGVYFIKFTGDNVLRIEKLIVR